MNQFLRLILVIQLFGVSSVYSQNVPTASTGPSQVVPKQLPKAYSTTPVNYVRVYSPSKAITDTSLVNLSSAVEDVGVSTKFMDSYGRTLQVVYKQGTPGNVDFVVPYTYDEFGNQSTGYLPFAAQSGNTSDGKFKLNPFVQDSIFYKSLFPNEQINYGEHKYDGSPLNLPVKSTAPGNSWTGSGVGLTYTYRTNSVADSVRLWTMTVASEDDIPVTDSQYRAGTLQVVETTDERGVKLIKYTDILGRLVFSKKQLVDSPSSGHTGWLCTYYVYDEMNNVRSVIPPKAVEALNGGSINWSFAADTSIYNNLCFAYFYDSRGRVTMKRVPGGGKSYIAYDLFDRVVMTQDGKLRSSNQWQYVKYDGQSRIIQTGLITSNLIKDSIWAQASRSTDYPTVSGSHTVLKDLYYDDYNWVSTWGYLISGSRNASYDSYLSTSYSTWPYPVQPVQSSNTRGKLTGDRTNILGTPYYISTVNIYDDKGRKIQSQNNNIAGGLDVVNVQYSFDGKVLNNVTKIEKVGGNTYSHVIVTRYGYDAMGRLLTLRKALASTITGQNYNLAEKNISAISYNELGQLVKKVLGPGIDSIVYSYNIRG